MIQILQRTFSFTIHSNCTYLVLYEVRASTRPHVVYFYSVLLQLRNCIHQTMMYCTEHKLVIFVSMYQLSDILSVVRNLWRCLHPVQDRRILGELFHRFTPSGPTKRMASHVHNPSPETLHLKLGESGNAIPIATRMSSRIIII